MGRRLCLNVNVDQVAGLRQGAAVRLPDPVYAAQLAEQAGADAITMSLRADRGQVQERDLFQMREMSQTRFNLVVAISAATLEIAKRVQPEQCCLAGERDGRHVSLDPVGRESDIAQACESLAANGMRVALRVDPDPGQIEAASRCGAAAVQINTLGYTAAEPAQQSRQLQTVADAVEQAAQLGLEVTAGGGLNYHNVSAIAALPVLDELLVGNALVAQALWIGIPGAVREMRQILRDARSVFTAPAE